MKNNYSTFFSAIVLSLILQGCLDTGESDREQQIKEDNEIIQAYLDANDIEAEETSSGVYYEVLEENEQGKQVVQDHVVGIRYTMKHLSGEQEIESNIDSLAPLRFSNSYNMNYTAIHPIGLNYEISKMKEGEKFRFYIPSYQAFGNYSHDELFDSYSNFIIDVDLVELKTEDEIYDEEVDSIKSYIESNELEAESYPNGLYHILVEEGTGEKPNSSSQIEFHYTRKYLDGTVIESTLDDDPAQVAVNGNDMVPGLRSGIMLMKEGEKANLIMPSKIAFGKSSQVIPQQMRDDWVENGEFNPATKPYSSVIYEVELISVD
ncbi:MAG: FKBP-type peptidyl-prolyl cis-trans isomerase [Balneolales bacterium]